MNDYERALNDQTAGAPNTGTETLEYQAAREGLKGMDEAVEEQIREASPREPFDWRVAATGLFSALLIWLVVLTAPVVWSSIRASFAEFSGSLFASNRWIGSYYAMIADPLLWISPVQEGLSPLLGTATPSNESLTVIVVALYLVLVAAVVHAVARTMYALVRRRPTPWISCAVALVVLVGPLAVAVTVHLLGV